MFVHLRIHNVFRHAIELLVRRNWLDDPSFVLRAIVTKCGRAIKFPEQPGTAARHQQT